jgi:hypothetical protein
MTRSQCSQCGKFNPADIHTCPTTEERFWAKVAKSEDCWLWTAAKFDNGYGAFWLNGRQMRAHRYSFELAGGERRPDQILDHKCHTKACVRPRGHAYTGLDINGRRVCRICSRAWDREYRKRRKAA